MGCCTQFHKTWWPGYGSDYIDPDKSFDFQRRVALIKKIAIAILILAIVIALAYLLVRLISGGDSNDCPQNVTETTESKLHRNKSSVDDHHQPNTQALNLAGVATTSYSSSEEEAFEDEPISRDKSEEEEILHGILGSNSTSVVQDDVTTILNGSDIALVSFPNNGNGSKGHHLVNASNLDTRESQEAMESPNHANLTVVTTPSNQNHSKPQNTSKSDVWCSSKENVIECIALSKNFRTITTFLPSRKHNDTVEGYVMVKMKSDKWHPYCHPNWTLEMGYRLCKGLGFRQLIRLEAINLSDLQQRVTKLGKQVSLHFDNAADEEEQQSTKPQELLILTTGKPNTAIDSKKLHGGKICEVGFISCN